MSERDEGRGHGNGHGIGGEDGDRDGDRDGDGGDYSDPGYMVGCDQGTKENSDNDDIMSEHHTYQSRGHVHGHGKYICSNCTSS